MYISKRDNFTLTEVDTIDEKHGTVILKYINGERCGKTVSVANSTFKRWWKQVEDDSNLVNDESNDQVNSSDDKIEQSFTEQIDMDVVNTPYPEPKEKKYVPKPQSVVEYENSKKRRKVTDLPSYEELTELVISGGLDVARVNSGYISLNDKTKIKRLGSSIGILASEKVAEVLVSLGHKSKPCIENGTPFRFDITNKDDLNAVVEALGNRS